MKKRGVLNTINIFQFPKDASDYLSAMLFIKQKVFVFKLSSVFLLPLPTRAMLKAGRCFSP